MHRFFGEITLPWGPLAGGFLSGKYQREDIVDKGRISGTNPFEDTKFTDPILDTLKQVAAEMGKPIAEVALAWMLTRKGISSTRISTHSASPSGTATDGAGIYVCRRPGQLANRQHSAADSLWRTKAKRVTRSAAHLPHVSKEALAQPFISLVLSQAQRPRMQRAML